MEIPDRARVAKSRCRENSVESESTVQTYSRVFCESLERKLWRDAYLRAVAAYTRRSEKRTLYHCSNTVIPTSKHFLSCKVEVRIIAIRLENTPSAT